MTEQSPLTPVDADAFRYVVSHFTSGVAVITSRSGDTDFGMTASAVSSVSMDPPMLLICLNTKVPTQSAVADSGAFTVNILDSEQGELARRFAMPAEDKFADVHVRTGSLGQPCLADALAQLECRVVDEVAGGTHRIFLGEVIAATARAGSPLAYYRGQFGRFELRRDSAYEELFEAKLAIDLGVAELVADRVPAAALSELREQAEQILAMTRIDGATPAEQEQYVAATAGFQEALVGLSGNAMLIDAYHRLSIVQTMSGAFSVDDASVQEIAGRRLELLDALAGTDLPRVRALMKAQHLSALAAHRHATEPA